MADGAWVCVAGPLLQLRRTAQSRHLGPGDVVIPSLTGLSGLELRSLSAVVVVEEEVTAAMERAFLEDQLR
jgi:hypothetical protein